MSRDLILVTGGAGYIGSHTALALRDAGFAVVVVDDLSTGRRELVAPGVPLVVGSVADSALMSETFARYAPAAIVHFAGSVIAEESVRDPLKYYRNNSEASRSLIESCLAAGIHDFIFSSTAAVYGRSSMTPVGEDSALEPRSPYGRSKLLTELILRDVSAVTALRYVALRYFNVAGADPEGRVGLMAENATHLIKRACEAALGRRPSVSIFGTDYDTPDGTCIRDYIHVSDLAQAHVVALRHLLARRQSLVANVGYGRGYSVREVLTKLTEIAGPGFVILDAPRRAGDPVALIADNRRIVELGWTPRYDDLAVLLETSLAWERRLPAARPA